MDNKNAVQGQVTVAKKQQNIDCHTVYHR